MTGDEWVDAQEHDDDWPITNPWPALIYGLGATALAFLFEVEQFASGGWVMARLALIVSGMIAAGGAAAIAPRNPAALAVAGVTSFVAYLAMDAAWDSARLVLAILAVVALVAAGFAALPLIPGIGPRRARIIGRSAVVVGVVLHFGGILTAVTSVAPPNAAPPWLSMMAYTHFYRPYLQFMYLTNAYHFYSPDPGPATLLWARIEYADGSSRWIKIPNREEHWKDRLGQQYYRRLSLTENINHLQPAVAHVPEVLVRERTNATLSTRGGISRMDGDRIPLDPNLALNLQYRRPMQDSEKLLSAYGRYLARHSPHPEKPELEVVAVKIYRIIHNMMQPSLMIRQGPDGKLNNNVWVTRDSNGKITEKPIGPLDPIFFYPFFMGEYDRDGKLLNPNDPFLYWLIPVIPVSEYEAEYHQNPALQSFRIMGKQDPRPTRLIDYRDYFTVHAGSSPWGEAQ